MSHRCEEHWDPLITHYILGDLEEEKEVSVLNHLQTCDRCKENHKQRKQVKEKLSGWSSPLPSSTRRDEVLARMNNEHQKKQGHEKKGTPTQMVAVFLLFAMTGAIIAALLSGFYLSRSATAADPVQLQLRSVQGDQITLRTATGKRIQPHPETTFSRGDTIWTGDHTQVVLQTSRGNRIVLDENTTLRIGSRARDGKKTHLFLQKGSIRTDIRKHRGEGKLIFLTPSGQVEAHDAEFNLTVQE